MKSMLETDIQSPHTYTNNFSTTLSDQAFGLTSTSRLGCQFCIGKQHEGILVKLPLATRNFYVVSKASLLLDCLR